jgi:multidrug efflux system membrane fusion protein
MKPWLKWALTALLLCALAAGVWQAGLIPRSQQAPLETRATQRSQTVVELAGTDVVRVKTRELAQGVPISGALKAANTALVKARVAGELQGLTVREGDTVKAGQIIARIDSTEYQARVRQAQQQAQAAAAQVDIARRQFENNRSLVAQGFISKTALESSTASLAAAEATYQAAQANADIAAKAVGDTVMRAPLSGVISQRLAQPGERVAVEGRIVEIVDLSQLELEAALSAGESLTVRVGQTAQLQIEGSAQKLNARVVRINPSAVAGSRAVLVYLAVQADAGLRQGLFAQGTLGTQRVQAMVVPLSAVRTDKPEPYVQLIDQGQVVHQRVQMGARGEVDGQAMVAIAGVAENATVVAGTVGVLREGSAVKLPQSGQ